MSASKRHLYQPASQAHAVHRGGPRNDGLKQGERLPVGADMQLSWTSPMRSGGSDSPTKDHGLGRSSTSQLAASSNISDGESLNPRPTIPQQYSSPVRSRPSEDLTPSDEEDLVHVVGNSRNVERMASPGALEMTDLVSMRPQIPLASHGEPSSVSQDVSTTNDIWHVETLDAQIASGEVLVAQHKVVSPAKVVRHDVDRLGSVPVNPPKSSPSLNEAVAHTTPSPESKEIADGKSGIGEASGRKSSKQKGRFVQSRYMQQAAAAASSKPLVAASKPASRSKAAPAAGTAKKPSPPLTKAGQQSSSATAKTRSKPLKATGSGSHKATKASRPGSAAAPTTTVSFRTPHHLPAEQALLRARQAVADSIFTPSLEAPTAGTISSLARAGKVPKGGTPAASAKGSLPARPSSGPRHAGPTPGGPRNAVPKPSSVSTLEPNFVQPANPHQAAVCYARSMQWAYVAAKVEHTIQAQEKLVEQQIYAVWQEVESLRRQEAAYMQHLASLRNAEVVDSIVYSQLGALRNVVAVLDRLHDSHETLANALTTVHHQLPVKGFSLPPDLDSLVHTLEKTSDLLNSLSRCLCSPLESSLPEMSQALGELDSCIQDEHRSILETKELLEKACRLQTSLTSLSIHDVQLQSVDDE